MDYPKTLSAARRAKGAEWHLADTLLEEVGPRGSEARFRECAEFLDAHGIAYTTGYLATLHALARTFAPEDRYPWLTVTAASEAGKPAVVAKAVEIKKERCREEGVEYEPPSKREMRAARKVVTHHARQATGKTMPDRKARADSARASTSELRRTADVLGLTVLADKARGLADRFVREIAGRDIRAEERRELLADIDETMEAWAWARAAVENPLADEISRYLEEVA